MSTPEEPVAGVSTLPVPSTITALDAPALAPLQHLAACAFDAEWYLAQYPDIRAAGVDPVIHYRESGWQEDRWPNRFFDPKAYRQANPDLAAYGDNLFLHYIYYGFYEARRLKPA